MEAILVVMHMRVSSHCLQSHMRICVCVCTGGRPHHLRRHLRSGARELPARAQGHAAPWRTGERTVLCCVCVCVSVCAYVCMWFRACMRVRVCVCVPSVWCGPKAMLPCYVVCVYVFVSVCMCV